MVQTTLNETYTFFRELAASDSHRWIRGISGTCRFDLAGFGSRYLTLEDGYITVTVTREPADLIISGDVEDFELVVAGKKNLMTAYLQGKFRCEGWLSMLYIVQRLFPDPPSSVEVSRAGTDHTPIKLAPPQRVQDGVKQLPPTPAQTVHMLNGNTFVISDLRGDIEASPIDSQGLFSWDTRYLSRWKLTVNGQTPKALATDDLHYYTKQFFLVPPSAGIVYIDSTISIIRIRTVGRGFHEQLCILNHGSVGVDLDVRIEAGSDFADMFEIKEAVHKKGQYGQRIEEQRLVLTYQRESFKRETWIESTEPVSIESGLLRFAVHIEAHSQWTTDLDIVIARAGVEDCRETAYGNVRTEMAQDLEKWIEAAPSLRCEWPALEHIYRQSLIDLAALRFYLKSLPGEALPAAGLPWFMTIFGRDSIITSLQTLPFAPELAVTTLRALAYRQGSHIDDFRDEEPGKIIHESRFGEMTAFEERPHSPYYGSADATPLFLILLDEMELWTGNGQLVKQLEWNARAALDWIDLYGDQDGDGYVEYNRRNKQTGLENQCWKDSWNSILFADGSHSHLPRRVCEIQGYVYDAKRRCARLARKFWNDPALAERLERDAADLKRRFNRDFWLPDKGYFALAIDGKQRKVDALTSNIGHLLWSKIVDDDKIESCVRHLMSERLFSGWGIRTMASGEGGYNPIGYHNGTVWPHDNAIIAYGLAQNGYRREATQVATGILEAAVYFNNRLPEAFAGYERTMTQFPVEYPTACSPQAWATGAPLLLLRTILGLEPIDDHLLVNPSLPEYMGWLMLLSIPGRWGKADAFGRSRSDVLLLKNIM